MAWAPPAAWKPLFCQHTAKRMHARPRLWGRLPTHRLHCIPRSGRCMPMHRIAHRSGGRTPRPLAANVFSCRMVIAPLAKTRLVGTRLAASWKRAPPQRASPEPASLEPAFRSAPPRLRDGPRTLPACNHNMHARPRRSHRARPLPLGTSGAATGRACCPPPALSLLLPRRCLLLCARPFCALSGIGCMPRQLTALWRPTRTWAPDPVDPRRARAVEAHTRPLGPGCCAQPRRPPP
ncbi:MAG: hypothetical protein J3K34DRAFT_414325 [Monoraphidium minutum]|nr:MAG: hypothetical protein J3K34DRAFT_414325 [Monoraphidium minutum]